MRDRIEEMQAKETLRCFQILAQLVEVVSHDGNDEALLKQARAFVGAIDRLPLPVKSSPGFVVNRALTPYMLEAMVMLDAGVDKTVIDAAAEKFGMPMGPI